MAASALLTVGEIARQLRVPVHRVEYLIRARGIQPAGWAGNARVFSKADVAIIAGELDASPADDAAGARGGAR